MENNFKFNAGEHILTVWQREQWQQRVAAVFVSAALMPTVRPALSHLTTTRVVVCQNTDAASSLTATLRKLPGTQAVATHRDLIAFWRYRWMESTGLGAY